MLDLLIWQYSLASTEFFVWDVMFFDGQKNYQLTIFQTVILKNAVFLTPQPAHSQITSELKKADYC